MRSVGLQGSCRSPASRCRWPGSGAPPRGKVRAGAQSKSGLLPGKRQEKAVPQKTGYGIRPGLQKVTKGRKKAPPKSTWAGGMSTSENGTSTQLSA